MYLSRLVLNSRSRAVRNDLADCRGIHRTILSAFPQANNEIGGVRAAFGILFRADIDIRRAKTTLLVQSGVKPDWSQLPKEYLDLDIDEIENPALKRIEELYGTLTDGVRLRFRLRANPTRRISNKNHEEKNDCHRKRVEINGEANQLDWLRRKGEQHGFRLLTARINPNVLNARANSEGKVLGWRSESKQRMKFGSVLFEGELEIINSTLFNEALANGIGSGKAYGFGLLSIARAG